MNNKFYKVTCKCGHVGKKYFIRINFPVIATCGKDASAIARYIPRVKHDHKDAILNCCEITQEEFENLQSINKNDPYLKCDCIQEQRNIEDFFDRLELEPRYAVKEIKTKRESVSYKLKKQKYMQMCYEDYEYQYEGGSLNESLAY